MSRRCELAESTAASSHTWSGGEVRRVADMGMKAMVFSQEFDLNLR